MIKRFCVCVVRVRKIRDSRPEVGGWRLLVVHLTARFEEGSKGEGQTVRGE
jgi:hypothetical protein